MFAGSLPLSQILFSHHFLPVTFSQLCTPSTLLRLHLYHFVSLSSTQTIFCIAFLRATAQTIKYDEISEKLIVTRQHQDVNLSIINPPNPSLPPQTRTAAGASSRFSYSVCASLDSVVEATRLPGLYCQDLPCLPEDKAITGGGVLCTVVSRYLEHLPHCKCSLHMALRFDTDAC